MIVGTVLTYYCYWMDPHPPSSHFLFKLPRRHTTGYKNGVLRQDDQWLLNRCPESAPNEPIEIALYRLENSHSLLQVLQTGSHMRFAAGVPKIDFLPQNFPKFCELGLVSGVPSDRVIGTGDKAR